MTVKNQYGLNKIDKSDNLNKYNQNRLIATIELSFLRDIENRMSMWMCVSVYSVSMLMLMPLHVCVCELLDCSYFYKLKVYVISKYDT